MKIKSIISLMLALILVVSTAILLGTFSLNAAESDIASAEDFMAMTDGSYTLTEDITLTETLASFSGTLDGNGHTITVSAPVFAELTGTVKNLTVAGAIEITEGGNVGALASVVSGATVEGVTSTVTFTGSANGSVLVVGGVVGKVSASTVSKSVFDGSIDVKDIAHGENSNGIGGVAGFIENETTVSECINKGSVKTTASATSNKGPQGGVVGFGQSSTITKCINTGDVTADASKFTIGGILGRNQPTTGKPIYITYCANTGAITKTNSTGEHAAGIVGYFKYGSIKYSYNSGTIANSNGNAGGIFGYINVASDVVNNFDISCNYNIGTAPFGIGFSKNDSLATFIAKDNYYLSTAAAESGSANKLKGTTVDSAEALNAIVLAYEETPFVVDPASNNGFAVFSWQCTHSGELEPSCVGNVCAICGALVDENGSGEHQYPDTWTTVDPATVTEDGSEERVCTVCGATETKVIDALGKITPVDGVYGVTTEDQLVWLVYGINNGTLDADISIALKADITLTNGLDMITTTFKGSFDGENHTLSGLTNVLFKRVEGSFVFKNVTLNGDVDCTAYTDGDVHKRAATITAYAARGYLIENVVSNVNIKVNTTDLNAGGLLGFANAGTVRNCTYAGTYTVNWTSGKAGALGGIIGWLNDDGKESTVTDCAFTGKFVLTNSEETDKTMYAGGIVGWVRNDSAKDKIIGCVNTGTFEVTATGSAIYVGGIVGGFKKVASNVLQDSVFNGTITADAAKVGTLVGLAGGEVPTTNCVSLKEGALVGEGTLALTDCYDGASVEKIDGAIVREGVTYQKYNFGYLNETTSALVDPADIPAGSFNGTCTEGDDGVWTIATDEFAAFISARNGKQATMSDLRFVIAADLDTLANYSDLYVTITFTKGDATVVTLTKKLVEDLSVYLSVQAAGLSYTAAENDVLFGQIITDVPNTAWDSVTLMLTDGELPLVKGAITPEDAGAVTDGIDLRASGMSNLAIEDHHDMHDKNLALAFYLGDTTAWSALYNSGTPVSENGLWTLNEGYTATVIVNGKVTDANRYSYYGFKDGDVVTRGFFRFELGAFSLFTTDGITCKLNVSVTIKDPNGDVVCYAEFSDLSYSTLDYTPDADNPGKSILAVTPISGPASGENEGFEKLFDTKTNTKLCKTDRTPVIFSLEEAKALSGISLLTANDNAAYTGRLVSGFTVYGCATNSTTDSDWAVVLDVDNAGMSDVNFTEYYYAIDGASAYSYYKIVFDGTNLIQLSELWVYAD